MGEQSSARLPRIPFDEPVMLLTDGLETVGRARNLSEGGLYVETRRPPPPRCPVRISFRLPGSPEPIDAEGTVLRIAPPGDQREPPGAALCFDALGSTERARLRGFITGGREQDERPATMHVRVGSGPALKAHGRRRSDGLRLLECELPMFRIGSTVQMCAEPAGATEVGTLAWVSVQTPDVGGAPRIHLGVQVGEATHEKSPMRGARPLRAPLDTMVDLEPPRPKERDTLDEPTVELATIDDATIDEPTVERATIDDATIGEPTVERATIDDATIGEATVEEPTLDLFSRDEVTDGAAGWWPTPGESTRFVEPPPYPAKKQGNGRRWVLALLLMLAGIGAVALALMAR